MSKRLFEIRILLTCKEFGKIFFGTMASNNNRVEFLYFPPHLCYLDLKVFIAIDFQILLLRYF